MNSAACDPFFLDWGSSVNVNEDLRRTIRAEIEEIDTTNSTLQGTIQTEKKTLTQIEKDFTHAQNELITLGRYSREEKENSAMNRQIQDRLRDAMEMEVLAVVTPARSTITDDYRTDMQDTAHNDFENEDNNNGTSSMDNRLPQDNSTTETERSLVDMISIYKRELNQGVSTIKKDRSTCGEYKEQIIANQCEIATVTARIAEDRKNLDSLNTDVDDKHGELQEETQRVRKIKASIQSARKSSGDNAQMIANHTKTLSANEKSHRQTEETNNLKLHSIKDDIYTSKSEIATLEDSKRVLTNQLNDLNKQLQEYESIQAYRTTQSTTLEEEKTTNEELVARETELTDLKNKDEDELSSAISKLSEAERLHEALIALKADNDKEEVVLASSRTELANISKEKESLVKTATSLDEKMTASKKDAETTRHSNELTLKKISDQEKEQLEQFEASMSEFEALKQSILEKSKSAQAEVDQHESLAKSFHEATVAQRLKLDDAKMNRQKEWESNLKQKKGEMAKERDAKRAKLDMMKQAIEFVLEMECIEGKLHTEEIVVSEVDGKAVVV